MKIEVTEEAADWYKEELYLRDNDTIRFFVRYGGVGGQIPGFSLGVSEEQPILPHTITTVQNITFFIEETDAWYFENNDLHIHFDKEKGEPLFVYK